MSDHNQTVSPQQARQSGAFRVVSDITERHAKIRRDKAMKAAERPVRAMVDDITVKVVGAGCLWWAFREWPAAAKAGDKVLLGVVVGVACFGFACLVPTQTMAFLQWLASVLPFTRKSGGNDA